MRCLIWGAGKMYLHCVFPEVAGYRRGIPSLAESYQTGVIISGYGFALSAR